ncbi:nuclear transport factor 2 family protein [Sinimarinibacterium sp. CAU 1509]|uniref:nuclear transport factor 2 family protein n=1 Tax=Sinimarinibacterium sp. CAU 1509 TaxID=2562283 RepID=UPI0010AD297E|nr:nuclear transport factor 2 family protein [Sinimarinibacterium sp. CAU 1509]TJY64801.1 nuclear transport factor 2 family protein [Sinimarinibacterium sp. CAU 1509]
MTTSDLNPAACVEHDDRSALAAWHRAVAARDVAALDVLLADNAVFHSPVVHTPQRGKARTQTYLAAAFAVFFNDSFRYVREVVQGPEAVLEFTVEIDGIEVNGVDMITWDATGRIVDFKVMLRPLKAINLIHQKMAEMLQRGAPGH